MTTPVILYFAERYKHFFCFLGKSKKIKKKWVGEAQDVNTPNGNAVKSDLKFVSNGYFTKSFLTQTLIKTNNKSFWIRIAERLTKILHLLVF